jgi:hypothetical protein
VKLEGIFSKSSYVKSIRKSTRLIFPGMASFFLIR